MRTPRNLVEYTLFITCPLILIRQREVFLKIGNFLFELNKMKFVLLIFNDSLLHLNQESTLLLTLLFTLNFTLYS